MRDTIRRAKKYGAKLTGDHQPLPGQASSFKVAAGDQVAAEHYIKGLGISPMLQNSYMVFAKQILKILGTHAATTASDEVCYLRNHWVSRGLDATMTNNIVVHYGIPACAAPVVPCREYVTQETCEAAGCCWTGVACIDAPCGCEDYVTESACEAAGCCWTGTHCIEAPCGCADYDTQEECEENDCFWWGDACHDAPECENFLAPVWVEDDIPGKLTITIQRAEAVALPRNGTSYFYRDMGAGHFAGNVDHDLTIYMNSATAANGRWGVWALSDALAYKYNVGNGMFVAALVTAGGDFVIDIGYDHYAASDRSITLSKDTPYYVTIKRTGIVFTCDIYSDAARTVLVDTLLCACPATAYRYIYCACPEGTADPTAARGYCDCLKGLV